MMAGKNETCKLAAAAEHRDGTHELPMEQLDRVVGGASWGLIDFLRSTGSVPTAADLWYLATTQK